MKPTQAEPVIRERLQLEVVDLGAQPQSAAPCDICLSPCYCYLPG